MTKLQTPTWFDRINRYRIAAAFLYVLFILSMVGTFSGHPVKEWLPWWLSRALFWSGLLVLTVALAMDAWEPYAGKRRVKRLIAEQQKRKIDDRA